MKKKIYLAVLILMIFNLFLVFSPTNEYISNTYEGVISFFQNVGSSFQDAAKTFESNWKLKEELNTLKEENEELRLQKDELRIQNDTLKSENEELTNSLEFSKNISQQLVMANILYKESTTPLDIFVIDKGSEEGIKENQIVTYNGQMIGYIMSVDEKESEVMLLENNNVLFNIPVKIYTEDKTIDAIIESYSIEKEKLLITTLSDQDVAKTGDKVYTNGYLENEANGVYVGEIVSVDSDDFSKKYYVNLKHQNYDYVEVVTNENK